MLLQLKDDSAKLSLLKKQAVAIVVDDTDKLLHYAIESINLAQKLNLGIAEGEAFKIAVWLMTPKAIWIVAFGISKTQKNIYRAETKYTTRQYYQRHCPCLLPKRYL